MNFTLRYDSDRKEVLPFIPTDISRLLDVGCATGRFAEIVSKSNPGLEVWGVESDTEAAALARNRVQTVVTGSFPDVLPELPLHSFDCIVFNDVLEHMVAPDQALSAASTLLKSDGVVVASIPNVRHLTVVAQILRGDFRYSETGILDRTHLRFFTRRSMVRFFEESGWSVDQIGGINWTPAGRVPTWPQVALARLSRGRINEFMFQQYVVVARREVGAPSDT